MLPYRTLLRLSLMLAVVFTVLPASSQFRLLWEKPIQLNGLVQAPDDITGISELDGGHLIMFRIWDLDVPLPAFAFLDKNDKLWPAQFLDIDSLSNVTMVGATRKNDRQIRVMCNDYTDRGDGKAVPVPFEITLLRKETDTMFLLDQAQLTNVTNLKGDKSFMVTDNAGDGNYGQYMSIVKKNADNEVRSFIYSILPGMAVKNIQFEGCDYAQVWFANNKVAVVSVETPMDNNRFFYQIHVLDHELRYIQSYPAKDKQAVKNTFPPGSSDRLIRITYKPVQDIGFVSRQVKNTLNENMIGWYIFNGLPNTNPVFTQVGIEGNVQTTIGPVIPDNELVITDGDLKNGNIQVNNMIVSVALNDRRNHDLVLSVGDYYGLETSRQVLKGYIDSSLLVTKSWMNDNNQAYVVANTQKSLQTGEPGLFISKWEATEEAINNTWHKVKTAKGWSDDPYYQKDVISEKDKSEFIILDLDQSDPNYPVRSELIGQKFRVQDGVLTPYRSSYWFKGQVKIGRKKYDLVKFVIAKVK